VILAHRDSAARHLAPLVAGEQGIDRLYRDLRGDGSGEDQPTGNECDHAAGRARTCDHGFHPGGTGTGLPLANRA